MLQPHGRMIFSRPNNPFNPLVYSHASDPTNLRIDCTRNPFDSQLLPIFVLFSDDFSSSSSTSPKEQLVNQICSSAFAQLRRTFALPYATGFNLEFGDAVAFWTMHQSPVLFELLKEDNPKALIVLAFYCVLLQRSENKWYVEGHGRKLLANIRRRLGCEWESWITWPLHELGFTDDNARRTSSTSQDLASGVTAEESDDSMITD